MSETQADLTKAIPRNHNCDQTTDDESDAEETLIYAHMQDVLHECQEYEDEQVHKSYQR